MRLTSELKKDYAKKHGKSEQDSGSSEVQIAIFTHRITHLTGHLQSKKKDVATQRALLTLVSKRKRLLNYLKRSDINKYRALIKALDIRK